MVALGVAVVGGNRVGFDDGVVEVSMIFIGIDPGKHGAVVALDGDSKFIRAWDQPLVEVGKTKGKTKKTAYDEQGMRRVIAECLDMDAAPHHCPDVKACMENVHPMPKEGAVGAFTFGLGCGLWRGVMIGLQVPYQLVVPQVWARAMQLGATGKDAKERSVAVASRLWPGLDLSLKKHHDRAQAALIAEYGRRLWMGVQVSKAESTETDYEKAWS